MIKSLYSKRFFMRKLKFISIILFVGSVVCFGIAIYVYQTYLNVLDTFAYYGFPEKDFDKYSEITTLLFDLKFGIIKFSVLGFLSLIGGLFLLLKKFKNYEQENH